MFKQISGNTTVPSKVPSVSEVSDKKSQVFLTSSPRHTCQIQQWYLLPPVPFSTSCLLARNGETQIKALTLLSGEERSRAAPGSFRRSRGELNGWKARRAWQQLHLWAAGQADKGPLALPAASSNLHKSRPFSESSCWLSCLVRPQSRKPQREVDLLQFSTGSQASLGSQRASKRPGPPAGPVLGPRLPEGSQEEALGCFQLTCTSVPLIFSAIRGENNPNQCPAAQIMLSVTVE